LVGRGDRGKSVMGGGRLGRRANKHYRVSGIANACSRYFHGARKAPVAEPYAGERKYGAIMARQKDESEADYCWRM